MAATITAATHDKLLTEADARLSLELLELLLVDPDPSADSERRSAAGGYDVGMLALNGIRSEATTATIGLLGEAARLGLKALVDEIRRLLRQRVADDRSPSVRAAVGIRLPWLLANDPDAVAGWLATLFGSEIPADARAACWHGYLIYARYIRPTAVLLASEYDRALTELGARPEDDRGRPYDPDEMLGIHVGMAHLTALPVEGVETWLARFYARAADWRARLTRWIAEQAANAEATTEVRDRARTFLRDRVVTLTSADDADELKSGRLDRADIRPSERGARGDRPAAPGAERRRD